MKDKIAFASTLQRVDELLEAWNLLLKRLEKVEANDGSKLDTSIPVPDLDLTIQDLDLQVNLLTGEIQNFEKISKDDLLTVPPMGRIRLDTSLSKVTDSINSLSGNLKQGISSLNPETFQGSFKDPHRPQKTKSISFAEKLLAVGRSLDDAYVRLIHIKVTLPKSRRKNVFPGIVQDFRDLVKETELIRNEALKIKNNTIEYQKSTEKANSSVQKYYSQCEEARNQIIDASKSAKDAAESAKSSNDDIKKTLEQSSQLKQKVESFRSDFEAFQKSLDQHKTQLKEGTDEQKRLFNVLQDIEEKINEKNDQAGKMLANATIAGLAASFGETRDKLNKEFKKSRYAFYFSIFVLVILATPMILYILPGIQFGGSAIDRSTANIGTVVGDVIARVAILLPGIWFVSFTSKRASSLFRLREHYEYKYNMAVSVEGFKQQAKEIAPAIAGTTFYELLTRNPADVMDGTKDSDDDKPPNPLLDAIMRFLKREEKKEK